MPPLVRLRDVEEFRVAVRRYGKQVDLAPLMGLTVQRLSQLVTGISTRVPVQDAARIEQVLQVKPGTYFEVEGSDLLRDYFHTDDPGPDPAA